MLTYEEISWYLPHKPQVKYVGLNNEPIIAYLTGVSEDGKQWETTYKRKRKGCKGDIINVYDGKERGHKVYVDNMKLICRPLSDIHIMVKINGVLFSPIMELCGIIFGNIYHSSTIKKSYHECLGNQIIDTNIEKLPFDVVNHLIKWHFWIGDQTRFKTDIYDIKQIYTKRLYN